MNILSKWSKILAVSGLCAAITGCAIRPLPGDYGFVGIDNEKKEVVTATSEIVKRIRCEARHAVAKVTMNFLKDDLQDAEQKPVNQFTRDFLQRITRDNYSGTGTKYSFEKLRLEYKISKTKIESPGFVPNDGTGIGSSNFPKELTAALKLLDRFANSGIGYEFDFTITERNNVSAGAGQFDFPLAIGSARLGIGGLHERERKNQRTFRLVETIEDLVFNRELIRQGNCNERNFDGKKNPNYPIYGKINLEDSFATFALLVLDVKLGQKFETENDKAGLGKLFTQDLTDLITFTTTVEGSANPSITLDPLRTSANLTSASVNLSNRRVDTHQLRLILQEKNVAELATKLELDRLRDEGNAVIGFGTN